MTENEELGHAQMEASNAGKETKGSRQSLERPFEILNQWKTIAFISLQQINVSIVLKRNVSCIW